MALAAYQRIRSGTIRAEELSMGVESTLQPSARMRIEDTEADWITSIDPAADRASRSVARASALDRERELSGRFLARQCDES